MSSGPGALCVLLAASAAKPHVDVARHLGPRAPPRLAPARRRHLGLRAPPGPPPVRRRHPGPRTPPGSPPTRRRYSGPRAPPGSPATLPAPVLAERAALPSPGGSTNLGQSAIAWRRRSSPARVTRPGGAGRQTIADRRSNESTEAHARRTARPSRSGTATSAARKPNKKGPLVAEGAIDLAASYSPTGSPLQYHRRWKA